MLAQADNPISQDLQINENVSGTLVNPVGNDSSPLVILIQGSGPTDRNGNQPFMKNDSFKKLSAALAENGIATFRYDKRILNRKNKEADIRFDDFVEDASAALSYFQNSGNFKRIIVLGHSQGSLVGMLAAKNSADAFISVAGAAQPI
ncbi:alpha/beta hydrolase family protein, partial [Longispora fulva]|uniref:alpha/beta hydrolase family protein n=2 Tax=Bacteria TaxID=2 RepID=UPI0036261674